MSNYYKKFGCNNINRKKMKRIEYRCKNTKEKRCFC